MRIKEWLGFVFRPNKTKAKLEATVAKKFEYTLHSMRQERQELRFEAAQALRDAAEAYSFAHAIRLRIEQRGPLVGADNVIMQATQGREWHGVTRLEDPVVCFNEPSMRDICVKHSDISHHTLDEVGLSLRFSATDFIQASSEDIVDALMAQLNYGLRSILRLKLRSILDDKSKSKIERAIRLEIKRSVKEASDGPG